MKNIENDYYNQDDEGEGGSTGGVSGNIGLRYQDGLATALRDDLLSPEQLKRLLAVHKEIHLDRVNNQKTTRQERKALKEGPVNLTSRVRYTGGSNFGHGVSGHPRFETHPLAIKFSGMNIEPNENIKTNQKSQEELQNRYENRNELRLNNQLRRPPPTPRPGY